MVTLALKVYAATSDGQKITTENDSVIGKAAAMAAASGYIKISATSPGHITWMSAR